MYQLVSLEGNDLTIKEFAELANTEPYAWPKHLDYNHLQRQYWENVTMNVPIYGAGVSGTITNQDCKECNLNHLNTILDYVN